MVKNAELNEVVKGLQTQMESLQAQRVDILRVLAEQSESMKALRQQAEERMLAFRSLIQQVHSLQMSSPPKKDAAPPTPTTGLLHLCVSKVLLCSESIPTDESRSKSDLSDLKMATVDLVGEDKHTSDLVGEIDEPTDLVGKSNEMDLTGKLVITADLVGVEAPVAELVETKNDEEEIAEIEMDGAADEVTEMTSTIVGDVDGLPKPGIVAAPLVVVMECKITDEASYEINYVAAMTNMSSKSSAFASAKKSRREATFVKDCGKPHVAVRHCRQLGFKAASRYDGYSEQRGGGCEEAWSRRVARRLWRRSASARMRRRQDQVEPHGETTMVLKRHEVGTPRNGGDTRQDDGRVEAWSRRIAMKP